MNDHNPASDQFAKNTSDYYISMAQNLLSGCKTKLLYRLDVNF